MQQGGGADVVGSGVMPGATRVLVVSGDTLGARMAGPAIRALQMAQELARAHDVRLVTTATCELDRPDLGTRHVEERDLRALEAWCDVLVFQGDLLVRHPFLRESERVLVVDLYDPMHLEQLEQGRDLDARDRRDAVQSATVVLSDQMLRGDFFLCASEKQRDLWLGHLAALGRVNPVVYDADESLRSLIDVVPFGLPEEPPVATGATVRGVVPGIGHEDKVVLWGGGVYNWFDPLTLIRAVDVVKERVPEVRLLFMGMQHPNPEVPAMRTAAAAEALSRELRLTGRHVFFNRGWVPYEDRAGWLLEADVGVSTHLDHVETAFSFRTRILDYFWASLPVVCTNGDALAEVVEREGLGCTVVAEDVDQLAAALTLLLTDPVANGAARERLHAVAPRYTWSRALEPLSRFCAHPHRAPDLMDTAQAARLTASLQMPVPRWRGLSGDLRLVRDYLRRGGPGLVVRKAGARLGRLARGQRRARG